MFSFFLINVSIEQGASLLWLATFFGQICWDEFFINGEQPLISCWYLGEERLAFLVPQCQGAGGEQGQEYHQKLQVRMGLLGEKRGGWKKTVHLLNITSLL